MQNPPYKSVNSRLASPLMLALSILAGCAVGPDYEERAPATPANWMHAGNRANDSQATDLTYWWRRFNDPLLGELVEEALRNSPNMRSARAKLLETRARTDLVDAGYFPSVRASLSKTRSKSGTAASSDLFNAGLDASWELDVFGGQRRAAEAAEADTGRVMADLHALQVSLSAEVALNYVQVRGYQMRLQTTQSNLAAQAETLQITEWREQAGLVTTLEVEQARANFKQTEASIPALETGLSKAENRLAVLLGQFPETMHARLATPAALPALPDDIAIAIPAETMRQRPDVRAAERRVAAETARIGVASSGHYPSFTLSGSLGWKALTFGALGGSDTLVRSVTGGIAQTLFNGGATSASVRAQEAVQEQSAIAYEQTVLAALEDVEDSLAAYAGSRKRADALLVAADAANNAAAIARQRYESGLIDYQTVLETERTRLSATDSLASAATDRLAALIALYKALGGGWHDETDNARIEP